MDTPRFQAALAYAVQIHASQFRKGTRIPYIAHLLAVTSIVLEQGGSEDEAIGALLHDATEDTGGLETSAQIRAWFGPTVAEIVEGCSDTFEQPKPDWWIRKQAYLEHLPLASPSTRLVSAADKLHNLGSILRDYQTQGEALWSRFKAGKEGTLWYYRSLIEEFEMRGPTPIAADLKKVMSELEGLLERKGEPGLLETPIVER